MLASLWRRLLRRGSSPLPSSAYPDCLLRGLANKKCVDSGGLTSEAFVPDARTVKDRTDGMAETSINWEDDGDVLQKTFDEKNVANGLPAYPFGVGRVKRADVDHLVEKPAIAAVLAYERREEPGKPYHGNLLFTADLTNVRQRMIASALAVVADLVSPPRKT